MAAQLSATNSFRRRGDRSWSVCATSSLPVPLSPTISTDSVLVANDIDFEANQDNTDLYTVRVADGAITRLTRTRMHSEYPLEFLPDGSQFLVGRFTNREAIRSVRVADLIPRSP